MKFTSNSILSTHYTNYLDTLKNNNKIISHNLSDMEIQNLYNEKYQLTEFDIYKYITALDYIADFLGCNKFTLTEGISLDKNKYNNILLDLFFVNIPLEIMSLYPISVIFSIKQLKYGEIQDLTKSDIKTYKLDSPYPTMEFDDGTSCDIEYWDDDDTYSQWFKDYQDYKQDYKNYAGNSYTYYIFKQLTKLLLTEVYLFKYNGHIFTYNELINYYNSEIYNNSDPKSIKTITQLINDKEVIKIKYSCIKVIESFDINHSSLATLKICLIDTNKYNNFAEIYDTIIVKPLGSFWDYAQVTKNREFIGKLKLKNKF